MKTACTILFVFMLLTSSVCPGQTATDDSTWVQRPKPDLVKPTRDLESSGADYIEISEGMHYSETPPAVPKRRLNNNEGLKTDWRNWKGQLKVILILIGIGILAILIFFIIRKDLFRKKSDDVLSADEMDHQFEALIERGESPAELIARQLELAIHANDFRLAIRIIYLGLLSDLNEKHQIKWKKDKTNSDYLREMSRSEHYAGFSQLTLVFESAWYGNRQPDEETFINYQAAYRAMKIELDRLIKA